MTELPWMNGQQIEEWLLQYRLGDVNNEYGDFECSLEDCKCLFSNKLDYLIHLKYGRHGRIGDRFSMEERLKYKYSSRQGRAKQDIYRRQNQENLGNR